jgi:3-(3-hydroxy-phenyl)propionate hydroxylase
VTEIDVEVAIVGAGPVGLTAALALSRSGVSVVVLEQQTGPGTFWRASTFHPPTLDVADALGIVGPMLAQGLRAPYYQMRDYRSGPVARFDLGVLADETAWPFRLQLEQYKYAAIVAEKLAEYPKAEVAYGRRLTGLVQTDGHVELEINGSDRLTSRWLIAGDGSASTVRELAGIGFEGYSYPTRRLLVSTDTALDEIVPDLDRVNYVYAPVGAGMVLRIPDVWRVMFSLPGDVDDETAATEEYYAVRVKELLGVTVSVLTTQVYHVHQRVADTLKKGRVLLAGDAAHVNSPTGGMGLNSGVHDAVDLAATFTAARDNAHRALESWSTRRRTAAVTEIQRITHRNTVDLGESDEAARLRKQDEMRAVAADPDRAKEWLMDSSMINSVRRLPIGVPRVAPHSRVFAAELAGGAR